MFEGVDDLVLDLVEALLDCELALLLLLFVVGTESSPTGTICASDRRTVTMESVVVGVAFTGISTTVVVPRAAIASILWRPGQSISDRQSQCRILVDSDDAGVMSVGLIESCRAKGVRLCDQLNPEGGKRMATVTKTACDHATAKSKECGQANRGLRCEKRGCLLVRGPAP